jgi:hypothetical protein
MADEPEDDALLLDTPADEVDETEQPDEAQPEGDGEAEVYFGDEPAPGSGESDTGLVKHLRAEIRERDKRLAELSKDRPKVEAGPRPKLADFDYDEEAHEAAVDEWIARRAEQNAAETESAKSARIAREQWEREVQGHNTKVATLQFADAQEVVATATAALTDWQQAVVVKVADNSAQLLFGLGKHPAKLAELSAITDPLKMAAAVARLEGGLKVMPRRKVAEPEEVLSGSASITHGTDKQLEKLEKEADRTGDRSKLREYRKSKGISVKPL